ncbi:LLM class F420-dependent oxidoreductase [Sphaerisporangium melleum]|uniref:LLM class F420-dependent oxidoreductase n=1 Tax=Sphaerisporangium melleum TaxID=321316 RepID=A0A917RFN4_9ACTN|nr:LLM class F420-dependent oxidoreductase [Sphaerisporangium melleum]GGL05417.1 LLM class F420-dependent oxidoreductase [Sphaerisporangium melleum]GII73890.1 LLM class F420-dependent oxidoreductase [Sphaerisporangium melleum]
MRLSVSVGLWQDRPATEAVRTAQIADQHGYPEVWVGEMATYDAFALATAIGMRTRRIALTVGPLPVTVRDPMTIARGVASVADLTGRPVGVALGTSSPVVVEEWHGRSRAGCGTALRETVQALRPLLDGERSDFSGTRVASRGYRLRLDAPRSEISVAAFGPAAVGAAALADRMVLNLLTPASAARLITDLRLLTSGTRVVAWVAAAVDPDQAAIEQIRGALVSYLYAPGYGEMFARSGFEDVVAFARTRPHPRDLLAAIPDAMLEAVALIGDSVEIMDRLDAYEEAGVDEVAIVPVSTDADPCGEATLKALAE